LADTRQILSGHLPLEKMLRLATVLRNPLGSVAVELEFGIDEQKIRFARGHLQTTLDLTCQRCFMSMPFTVNTDLTMGFITALDGADLLPESYEPVLMQESGCSLLELIEDELLLSLPLVVRHKENECQVKQVDVAAYEDNHEVPVENPFAVLERFKKGQ